MQKDWQTDRQKVGRTFRQTDIYTVGQTHRQTDGQRAKQAGWQFCR